MARMTTWQTYLLSAYLAADRISCGGVYYLIIVFFLYLTGFCGKRGFPLHIDLMLAAVVMDRWVSMLVKRHTYKLHSI